MKKNYSTLLLLGCVSLSLFTVSCKQANKALVGDSILPVVVSEEPVQDPLPNLDQLALESAFNDTSTADVVLLDKLATVPVQKIDWLLSKYGKSTWFYEKKLSGTSFSKEQYLNLLRIVYAPTTPVNKKDQELATYAVQYSLYEALNSQVKDSHLQDLAIYVHSRPFLLKAVQHSPSLIRYVPRELPFFSDVAVAALKASPTSFDYLSLVDRLSDGVLIQLYRSKDALPQSELRYKKMALDYASVDLASKFVALDGMALQLAPDSKKDNTKVVLAAITRTPAAVEFASPRIQSAVADGGLKSLKFLPQVASSDAGDILEELATEKGTKQAFGFKSLQDVVRDVSLITRIEEAKQRTLSTLYLIADAGLRGSVYFALFQPESTHYLASIIYAKSNGTFVFQDYVATYEGKKSANIWYSGDSGDLTPDEFKVLGISKNGSLVELDLSWTQVKTIKNYRLIEQSSGKFQAFSL